MVLSDWAPDVTIGQYILHYQAALHLTDKFQLFGIPFRGDTTLRDKATYTTIHERRYQRSKTPQYNWRTNTVLCRPIFTNSKYQCKHNENWKTFFSANNIKQNCETVRGVVIRVLRLKKLSLYCIIWKWETPRKRWFTLRGLWILGMMLDVSLMESTLTAWFIIHYSTPRYKYLYGERWQIERALKMTLYKFVKHRS